MLSLIVAASDDVADADVPEPSLGSRVYESITGVDD